MNWANCDFSSFVVLESIYFSYKNPDLNSLWHMFLVLKKKDCNLFDQSIINYNCPKADFQQFFLNQRRFSHKNKS